MGISFFKVNFSKLIIWKSYLFKDDLIFRLIIGLVSLVCIFLFIHFREVKVETLELGTQASSYVVAQTDFDFPDDYATNALKQEALKDLGPIFSFQEKMLSQVSYDFEYYLIHDSLWLDQLKNVSLEDLYQDIEIVVSFLKSLNFTDIATLKKMQKFDISTVDFMVFTSFKGEKAEMPTEYWHRLENIFLKKHKLPKKEINFIFQFFAARNWQLKKNDKALADLKFLIESGIPQKYTEIKAGTRIVAVGEKVTARHIDMLLAMKQALTEKRNLFSVFNILGNLIFSFVFIVLSFLYLRIDQNEVLKSLQKLSLLVCIMILTLAFAKITEYVLLQNKPTLIESIRYPIIVPFAAFLLSILFNPRLALFGSVFLAILFSITLMVDHTQFLVINLITALIVTVSACGIRKRKEVFQVCAKCLLGVVPIVLSFHMLADNFLIFNLLQDLALSFLFMLIIAVLVMGILPLLESLFHVMTDITLMEYMDPSNELLKRLALEMPGTYQHSLVLGNITESVGSAIGANALLCRVATLYHDIGKLSNAHFFTENQPLGVNIHQLLTPAESAGVIISHVKDGVALAKKYRLPQSFIDIIQEHHGTTLVYYFYYQELQNQNRDKSKIDESLFRYPGPKPHSKESAIIMLSDSIEAASRSLEVPTESAIMELVDKVVKERVDDNQLEECNLTFEELLIIKKTLVKIITASHHVRIKYPEKETKS